MNKNDIELIKQLVPFLHKSEENLTKTLRHAKVTAYPKGKMIFKREDLDQKVHWLLKGTIDLVDHAFNAQARKSTDESTKYPIDNNSPHILTAVSTESTRILSIDRKKVGIINPNESATVSGIDETKDIDWMSALLSSPLFELVPPNNIQKLFNKLEEVEYAAGEMVIKQGDLGDCFYVIQSGRVVVKRTSSGKTIIQAILKPGDNFGQDALISNVPRNATVTMTHDGKLARLSGADFESLLVRPVVKTISLIEAQEMQKHSKPKTYILDVRNPSEVKNGKIPGSTNVPLLLLRTQNNMRKLKSEAVYITACDDGKRSKLAAYLLNESGFAAYVLQD